MAMDDADDLVPFNGPSPALWDRGQERPASTRAHLKAHRRSVQ